MNRINCIYSEKFWGHSCLPSTPANSLKLLKTIYIVHEAHAYVDDMQLYMYLLFSPYYATNQFDQCSYRTLYIGHLYVDAYG